MRKALMILGAVVIGLQGAAYAVNTSAGTSTAQFLKLGADARALAMGEAYAGIADGASAVYWNPAGLAGQSDMRVSLTQATWVGDISYQFLEGTMPAGFGTFGLGLQSLSYSSITETDGTGLDIGNFTPSDMMAALSFGREFGGLKAGATLKYISSRIKNTATAMALDAGAQVKNGGFTVGLAVQNLGTNMKFISQEETIPYNMKLGASYAFGDMWLAAIDMNSPVDEAAYISAGVEKNFQVSGDVQIAGRLGYNSRTQDLTGTKGMSAGVGLGYKNFTLDTTFTQYGNLGNVMIMSLGAKF
jgi:hypothetical protein